MRAKHTRPPWTRASTFEGACSLLDAVLTGPRRQDIIGDLAASPDFKRALVRLREIMRSNVVPLGPDDVDLHAVVSQYDARTRRDGFHVLHDWDGKADTVNDDIIPVDVLNYLIDVRGGDPADAAALAILLDYYFVHVLALLSLRVWDEGDPDANLDRLSDLLQRLQGPDGSGQQFVDNAETLILLATSHFELEERGFGALLAKVRTLSPSHQTAIALGHAASLASHLRFGFEATYARDTVVMRNDNVADYPWLCFALAAVMREYSRMRDQGVHGSAQEGVVEAILNGLTPDARAFVGEPPASLSTCEADRSEFRERFCAHRRDLLEQFQPHRPSEDAYSPLSFFFNFSHNVLKGAVVDALRRGDPWRLSFNDLLTGLPRGEKDPSKQSLAKTLMGYARDNPDTIRGRLMPVIVYDPRAGRRAFGVTMRKLKD